MGMSRSTRAVAVCVLGALLGAACAAGPESAGPSEAADEPAPAADQSSTVDPGAEEPTQLAFVDTDLQLASASDVQVRAGETVVLDHLVYNTTGGAASVRFGATAPPDLVVELSTTSIRLASEETFAFTSSVQVPDDAETGETITLDVQAAALGGDTPVRNAIALTVSDQQGERPEATATSGVTTTNEKILVYVLGSVSQTSDALDPGSLRVLWPGFRSDEATAANGTVTYHPYLNVTGRDLVLFEVCAAAGWCDTGTIAIDVNDTP